jgi:hypothetical protein
MSGSVTWGHTAGGDPWCGNIAHAEFRDSFCGTFAELEIVIKPTLGYPGSHEWSPRANEANEKLSRSR